MNNFKWTLIIVGAFIAAVYCGIATAAEPEAVSFCWEQATYLTDDMGGQPEQDAFNECIEQINQG